MKLTMCARPVITETITNGDGAGRMRAIILRLLAGTTGVLGHDRDGPSNEGHPSRIWPAVL